MNNTPFTPGILPIALQDMYNEFVQDPNTDTAQALAKEYFSCFSVNTINKEMYRMLAATLTVADMPNLEENVQRLNLMFFYEFTLAFVQAAEWLAKEER